MFLFSNSSAQGNSDIVIHFYKFFNIVAWQNSINIYEKYPVLKDFKLKPFNSVDYIGEIK